LITIIPKGKLGLTAGELLGIVWDDRFRDISFSHPMIRDVSVERIRRFKELISNEDGIMFIKPEMANFEDLLLVHDVTLIEKLREASSLPFVGFLDEGDTVHYPGMLEDILLVAGSTLTALKFSRYLARIYIPLGGFHHATRTSPMGFCPINDVAIALKTLQSKGERVALIDVDAHHPNGLEEMFYNEKLLKINVFAYDGEFFPRTGDVKRRGEGEGFGLNFNVGLPLGSSDDAFMEALRMLELVRHFKPTYIVVVAGVDGHMDDGLKSLNLTANSYNLLGQKVFALSRELEAKVISYGGGGYGPGSSISMYSFIKGLKGQRFLPEKGTEDREKREIVKNLVNLFLESSSCCLK
jgi:Deacetylases, including yeast histone deacetylase and acetoin utilization protein